MIDKFLEWANKEGWTVEISDKTFEIPQEVKDRYKQIPEQWIGFISNFLYITNATQDIWFLTCYDYLDSCYDFENMSLDAAEGDDAWKEEIKEFWNQNFPIIMSVAGDYHYFAINLATGCVVEGWEPEFEETREVASSFDDFLELLISQKIRLVV